MQSQKNRHQTHRTEGRRRSENRGQYKEKRRDLLRSLASSGTSLLPPPFSISVSPFSKLSSASDGVSGLGRLGADGNGTTTRSILDRLMLIGRTGGFCCGEAVPAEGVFDCKFASGSVVASVILLPLFSRVDLEKSFKYFYKTNMSKVYPWQRNMLRHRSLHRIYYGPKMIDITKDS